MKSELDRLRSEGSDFERRLLDAASSEAPSPELVLGMQQALGIASLGPSGTAAVAAKGSAAAWVAAGVVVTALGVGFGVWQLSRANEVPLPPRAGVSAPLLTATPPALAAGSLPEQAAQASGTPQDRPEPRARVGDDATPSVAPAKARPAPPGEFKGDLHQQIELIDRARAAVSRRAPEQALEALRQYVAEYPRGAFAPEAQVLRIEALEQSGRHAQALALANGFLAKHPSSPLAERVAKSVGLKPVPAN